MRFLWLVLAIALVLPLVGVAGQSFDLTPEPVEAISANVAVTQGVAVLQLLGIMSVIGILALLFVAFYLFRRSRRAAS